ncbi:MAG: AbrB/MazE/SpoVT family DNA-binding domain-containing protein [Calditrichales bacterium]|nr:MAG: AbrB/MazE/SpoVT family DNA-binding domain-containing protein [Calditrichales bacterium]
MKTKVIKIGNSHGIRLPKAILLQMGIGKEIDLLVGKDQIILKPIRSQRSGWNEAFRKMAARGDDLLLDKDSLAHQKTWDDEEWVWDAE